MKDEYAPLDIASHLDNDEIIAEYLTAAAEDEDPRVLFAAMSEVAKARGLEQVAAAVGLERDNLIKVLSGDSHPSFETIRAILAGMGVKLAMAPAQEDAETAVG